MKNLNNSSGNWDKKLKFDIKTNFSTGNSMVVSILDFLKEFTLCMTSQGSPGTKFLLKGSTVNNYLRNYNKMLKLGI